MRRNGKNEGWVAVFGCFKASEVTARSRALIGGPFCLVLGPARSHGLERSGVRLQMQLRPRATRPTVSSHGGTTRTRGSCDGTHRGVRRCDIDREHPEWDFGTARWGRASAHLGQRPPRMDLKAHAAARLLCFRKSPNSYIQA
ncbi:hypothetical protein PIB30_081579 [Stylosanthes scabra]|uniref:Uncharacterized protein n=1 Tax=Stylosanthes scabra TaxID=79078 RepID=A0ABU6XRI8_9FABA|nr:hypothetical protein [Stylosanthes scabra]